jgi:thiamine biosynthesis lipoprotein
VVSEGLAEAVSVALAAARWTSGLVDPTVGGVLAALGYDRDFAEISDVSTPAGAPGPVPGWRAVRLRGPVLSLPARIRLDLGATAKGLGSDRAAAAVFAARDRVGGVLVSLGGDLATAGQAPAGGWPILIANDHRQASPPASSPAAVQLIRLARGALATSSVTCRQWLRAGVTLHHIVDPRTGAPAAGPWRTVSVAAGDCATANAASTASIILGPEAEAWLAAQGLPARLVGHDGRVRLTGRWPAGDGGRLDPPGLHLITRRRGMWGRV